MSFEQIKEMISRTEDFQQQLDDELAKIERRTGMTKEVLPHMGATEEPNIAGHEEKEMRPNKDLIEDAKEGFPGLKADAKEIKETLALVPGVFGNVLNDLAETADRLKAKGEDKIRQIITEAKVRIEGL